MLVVCPGAHAWTHCPPAVHSGVLPFAPSAEVPPSSPAKTVLRPDVPLSPPSSPGLPMSLVSVALAPFPLLEPQPCDPMVTTARPASTPGETRRRATCIEWPPDDESTASKQSVCRFDRRRSRDARSPPSERSGPKE